MTENAYHCEILAPAGDERSARAALMSGADAVYLGLTRFSARSGAENFDFSALGRICEEAHLLGAKVYVCLNTLVKDGETEEFFDALTQAWNTGADAILLQDLFLGKRIKETCPELVLHLSTQAGCCNEYGARLAKECGFSRVVLARETPLSEIRKIAAIIETEVFVQGALCTCFSGQCYLSSFAGGNSGNRGRCKQPCRKRYRTDRPGYEDAAYALSPADLCVGRRTSELLEAGVVSLKIEGRMRRPEYVAAAVGYYRAILRGESGDGALSDLKRAYNRGDYTEGLAFGQKKDFLSRRVQGHIGERVGTIGEGGLCVGGYPARKGDGFKILRGGVEIGGAAFRAQGKGGFYLSSSVRLAKGDEVRLTTDSSLPARVFGERRRKIALSLDFVAGERARIRCGTFDFFGPVLPAAKNAPLTEEDLISCFSKTGDAPFKAEFSAVTAKNAFLPKSELNAVRRTFYEELARSLAPARKAVPAIRPEVELPYGRESRTAVIATDQSGLEADILIYKPADYGAIVPGEVRKGKGEKYLYLPPFFTGEDEALVRDALPLFDGIYCDGYYGILLAKKYRKKFFAGTGFNLSNRFAVAEAVAAGADCFALSKELSAEEQRALETNGAFALAEGAVKVMDLCYCIFEKTCETCDRRARYTLTDEDGRAFPLRRYRASGGSCRFELYNCVPLRAESGAGVLTDRSAEYPAGLPATRGHSIRSIP